MKRTRDIAGLLGLAAVVGGIACYDWRAALVFGGGALLVNTIVERTIRGRNAN